VITVIGYRLLIVVVTSGRNLCIWKDWGNPTVHTCKIATFLILQKLRTM